MMKKALIIFLLISSALVFTCCGNAYKKTNLKNTAVNKEIELPTVGPSAVQPKAEEVTTNIEISSTDFISPNVGYMALSCSKEGGNDFDVTYKLLKTEDGGHNWVNVANSTPIKSLTFIDEKLGFGVETSDKNSDKSWKYNWVKTVDGGLNWTPIDFVKGANCLEIDLLDKNTMFICGVSDESQPQPMQPLQIYRTANAGENWNAIKTPANIGYSELGGMSWLSMKEGYILLANMAGAGSEIKTLYYTSDGGETWSIKSKSEIPPPRVDNSIGSIGYCSGIKFLPNNIGYLGLSRGSIRKTTDGGITFSNITEYGNSHSVPDFVNNNEGFSVFNRTNLYHTLDGGISWEKILTADAELWNK